MKFENENLKEEIKSASNTIKITIKETDRLQSKVVKLTDDIEKVKGENKNLTKKNSKLIEEKTETEKQLKKNFTSSSTMTNTITTKSISTQSTSFYSDTRKLTSLESCTPDVRSDQPSTSLTKYLAKTSAISCQTEQHPDIPYLINCPLPPIFGSQLLHHTKPIKFISRSLPSLDSICWGVPSDSLEDKIDEMLSDQYDQQVKDFYIIERERVQAIKKDKIKMNMEESNNSIEALI